MSSRSMEWFRLYSEFFTDPKLKTFTKAQRYDVLALMSLASQSKERGVIFIDDEDLAATLELSEEDFAAFVAKMEKKGIAERCQAGHICIVKFLDRQYDNPSDRPEKVAERKAKHDAHARNEKERQGNDTRTTQERQGNDTYEESESENTQRIQDPPNPPVGGTRVSNEIAKTASSRKRADTPPPEYSTAFQTWWDDYPETGRRRSSKTAAFTQWIILMARPAPPDLPHALAVAKQNPDFVTQYAPAAERWLREGKFEALLEIEIKPAQSAMAKDSAERAARFKAVMASGGGTRPNDPKPSDSTGLKARNL